MPKKFPMNIRNRTKFSNCKSSRLLPTKGFDFEKDINNPIKCQQWAERFKIELKKGNKFNLLSDFHGFLTNVNEKLSKKSIGKLSGRPLKCLNMNNSWNKKFGHNNSHNTVSIDFDNMYLDCGDSKLSIGREIELQHLKELNILHLDIVQQQSEELIAKDKIIKTLQEENKNLRARLERIDRRVSLSLQRKVNDLSPITVETDFSNNTNFSCVKSDLSPRQIRHRSFEKSYIDKNEFERSPYKINADEPLLHTDIYFSKKDLCSKKSPTKCNLNNSLESQVLRFSPRERRLRKDNSNSSEGSPTTSLESAKIFKSDLAVICDNTRKTRSPVNKRLLNEEFGSIKKFKNEDHDDANDSEDVKSFFIKTHEDLTDHSLRSREKHDDCNEDTIQSTNFNRLLISPVPNTIEESTAINISAHLSEPQKQDYFFEASSCEPGITKTKLQPEDIEACYVQNEGILSTTEPYYLPAQFSVEFHEVLAEDGAEAQLEIPKWRIKPFSTLYAMEGTENLEDEIFLKRHAKPEQDERRRKRWDLQRMREQREYEKLRERYEKRNSTQDQYSENPQSLWPCPESTQTIMIENTLPVCAFGQPLTQIQESDFYVPWLIGKTPLQVGSSTRRKKK